MFLIPSASRSGFGGSSAIVSAHVFVNIPSASRSGFGGSSAIVSARISFKKPKPIIDIHIIQAETNLHNTLIILEIVLLVQ